jgi:hypothetical protein
MEESFNWLKPIINSCQNDFHIICCKNLLELFANKYRDETLFAQAYIELTEDLNNKIKP